MDKRIRIAGIAAAVAFSAVILTSPSEPLPLPAPTTTRNQSDSVEVIATNLDDPRSVAFAGGNVLVSEKAGRIRVVQDGALLAEPLATLRVADDIGSGLLGIAAHPGYAENRLVYAYYTYAEGGALWNKVMRITERDNRLEDAETVLDGIPGSRFSNGGALKFGPDGKLYVGTGSVSDSLRLSQDAGSLAGKILRINDDGTVPEDNPFPGSPVYSTGHRDPRGLAWTADGATMYSTDLGPSKNDEVNVVVPGGNYGWPDAECGGDGGGGRPGLLAPAVCFDPAVGAGGIVIYSGGVPGLEGMMILASTRTANLYGLDLGGDDAGAGGQRGLLGGLGRIRDVAQGPDGSLYAITANTDGKGFPDDLDDRLVRITG